MTRRCAGWPSARAIGADGVEAAFMLVQHADHDTLFRAAMLSEIVAAYRRGDLDGQSVALITDRLAGAWNQPQIYGTQASIDSGVVRFDPIADSVNVDARRATLGMLPLAMYRRLLDSVSPKRPR